MGLRFKSSALLELSQKEKREVPHEFIASEKERGV
jgi:hypothetical protein